MENKEQLTDEEVREMQRIGRMVAKSITEGILDALDGRGLLDEYKR